MIMQKIIGQAMTSKMMKKLQAGPQSLLPMSPAKGSGVKKVKMAAPKKLKSFIVRKQNPAFTPNTGGLTRPKRMR
jgi:hypothetical protein